MGRSLGKPIWWAALAAGALPVLAFPAPNLEFLAWFGLVPGLLIMRTAPSLREAVVRAWWFGAGFMLAGHYWLAPNIGPALLLVAVALGALWTGVGASTWVLLRPPLTARRGLAALLVVPSYWLIVEWIRSWQALGGPWVLLGTSQWQHPMVLALAAVGGVWLVSFVLVAANVALVILLAARGLGVRALGALAAATAVAAGPVASGLLPAIHPDRYVTVALVQPGLIRNPSPKGWASQRLTAGMHGQPDLIVWGESSINEDLSRAIYHKERARLEALSVAHGAPILVNQDSITPMGKSKVAVLVGPPGILATYTKTRLVPFGEYIPFRQQLGWLTKISKAAPENMIPGDGARVMTVAPLVPAGQRTPARPPSLARQHPAAGQRLLTRQPFRIGVLICFEAAFPDMSRVDAVHGARLIVYQTSDSTFQQSWAPAQHAALAAVRAAETGRPAVQAALTGVSAAFDASGRMLAWLGTSRRGVALVRVGLPPASALTPFDQAGDVVPWTAIAVAALAAVVGLGTARRGWQVRLVGIMGDGNRGPAAAVSEPETAGDEDRPAADPLASERTSPGARTRTSQGAPPGTGT
jgi:apolipoprotein N-acyltransferase